MAGKLYTQQGRTLSVQPVSVQMKQPSLEPLTSTIIKGAAKVAQDNYAMGNSIALHESLEYAYNQAKDSPEQFNKLADSAIKTFADKVPMNIRNDLMGKFISAKQKYATRVEANYYSKLDAEQEDKAYKLSEIQTDDILSQADALYRAVIDRDDKNAKNALQGYRNSQANLRNLANIKNSKGSYVFNQSERKTALNTQTGQMEAFQRAIDTLSKEELAKFDKEIFQDKLLFQQKTGADDKTYAEQDKYIKARRTALGDEEKRVIANQASFTAARLLSTRDPEQYEELKQSGLVSKDTLKAINDVYETAPSQTKVENAFALEKTLTMLNDVVGTFDQRFDETTNIQKAIAAFGGAFEKFSNDNSLDQKQQQEVLDMATRYISDGQFRNSIKGLFSDTAIAEKVKVGGSGWNSDWQKGLAKQGIKPMRGREVTFATPFGDKEKAERYAAEIGHEYTRAMVLNAMSGNYDIAEKIYQEGNRAVIRAANSDKIPEGEFNRMERDLAHGRPAYYTLPDGRTIQFKGYSNKDAVFETKI